MLLEKLSAIIQTLVVVMMIGVALIVTVYLSYISIPLIILFIIGALTYTYFINN